MLCDHLSTSYSSPHLYGGRDTSKKISHLGAKNMFHKIKRLEVDPLWEEKGGREKGIMQEKESLE